MTLYRACDTQTATLAAAGAVRVLIVNMQFQIYFFRAGVRAVRTRAQDSANRIVQPMNPRCAVSPLSVERRGAQPQVSGGLNHVFIRCVRLCTEARHPVASPMDSMHRLPLLPRSLNTCRTCCAKSVTGFHLWLLLGAVVPMSSGSLKL